MELKEFVSVCIDKAEKAVDADADKSEAIRLLQLAVATINKTIKDLEK
jgi:hypothetical protein